MSSRFNRTSSDIFVRSEPLFTRSLYLIGGENFAAAGDFNAFFRYGENLSGRSLREPVDHVSLPDLDSLISHETE